MNILIVNSADTPIYQQITRQIKEAILKGQLKSGDLLPSVRSLAKDLNISVITTRHAYDELENEGYTINMKGKGTYVADQNLELVKESKIKEVEEKVALAVKTAKSIGMQESEFIQIVNLLFEEE